MEYVKFGNAGVEVSRLALGCMDFPSRLVEKEAQRVVDEAIDRGVNFFDTADGYGSRRGEGEEILGRLIKEKRDKILLATKFWVYMEDRPNRGDCSRYHIMRAVDESLRRLDTDHIDLYQMHHPSRFASEQEILSTLDQLVKAGKIRYIGVSNHYAWQMAHMIGLCSLHNWEPLQSIQCRYNLVDREIENETVPFVERFNIATMIYGPLCGGILTGKYKRGAAPPEGSRVARNERYQSELTDELFDILDALRAMAEKYNIEMAQLAMAWMLSKPYITTVLMGGSKPEHFSIMYDLENIELSEEDLGELDRLTERYRFRAFENQPMRLGAPLALNWW